MVETSTDIRIDSPVAGQLPALCTQLVQRVRLTVPLPEAVRKGLQVLIKDGRSAHPHRSLDNLGLAAGVAYRPLLPIVLLDPHPFDGRRHLPMVAPPLVQVPQVVVQGVGLRRGRPLVHPRRTVLPGLTIGFQHALPVDQVQHGVAHHRRRALGLCCPSLELHGEGA
jgi:hypothetical protein